jgi:hypothetical protein
MAFNVPRMKILLSSQTASSSANITFNSVITSAYRNYYVELIGIVPATDATNLLLTFSSDNGASFLPNQYDYTQLVMKETGQTQNGGVNAAFNQVGTSLSNVAGDGGLFGNLSLYNFGVTGNSSFQGRVIQYDSVPNLNFTLCNGVQTRTTLIFNSIRFAMSSGNITSGTINLYAVTEI